MIFNRQIFNLRHSTGHLKETGLQGKLAVYVAQQIPLQSGEMIGYRLDQRYIGRSGEVLQPVCEIEINNLFSKFQLDTEHVAQKGKQQLKPRLELFALFLTEIFCGFEKPQSTLFTHKKFEEFQALFARIPIGPKVYTEGLSYASA